MYAQDKAAAMFQNAAAAGSIRGNVIAADVSTSRANGVEAQLEILESVYRSLNERVGQLREKLHPLLDQRDTGPQPPCVEAVPSCPLANRIAITRREMAALSNGLDDLMRDLAI